VRADRQMRRATLSSWGRATTAHVGEEAGSRWRLPAKPAAFSSPEGSEISSPLCHDVDQRLGGSRVSVRLTVSIVSPKSSAMSMRVIGSPPRSMKAAPCRHL
jgi:hypothetical protein